MTILAGQRIRALDLAGTAYDYETANDTTTSTSYVDGTVHGVAFTAPTSGRVVITWGGAIANNTTAVTATAVYLSIYVRTGSTVDAGSDVFVADDEYAVKAGKQTTSAIYPYTSGSMSYRLTGLTAGSSYNVITQFRATTSTAAVDNRWVLVQPAFE
jgi:hypothetical protein